MSDNVCFCAGCTPEARVRELAQRQAWQLREANAGRDRARRERDLVAAENAQLLRESLEHDARQPRGAVDRIEYLESVIQAQKENMTRLLRKFTDSKERNRTLAARLDGVHTEVIAKRAIISEALGLLQGDNDA